jgi:hypothetical protein
MGIILDDPDDGPLEMNADVHIIINDEGEGIIGGDGVDGIVSLETNDDFVMAGAPGAIVYKGSGGRRGGRGRTGNGSDVMP